MGAEQGAQALQATAVLLTATAWQNAKGKGRRAESKAHFTLSPPL